MAGKERSFLETTISKSRLEFLFDGIFAIAMTILVLELKLPEQLHDKRSVDELGRALLGHWRTFLGYIISFFILSGFWIAHNRFYARLARITRTILAVHVWLLAWAAFIPFCAHLLGNYPGNTLAHVIYLTTAMAYTLGRRARVTAAGRQKAFDPSVTSAQLRRMRRGFVRPLIAMALLILYSIFIMPVLK